MVRKRRLHQNPLSDAPKGNVRVDRRHDRRDLKPEELERLLAAAKASGRVHRGLTGEDRYWLYLAGCATGFRRCELASLTPDSFDLAGDRPTVTVGAAYDKRRRRALRRLPRPLAAGLAEYLRGKPAGVPVWPGTWTDRSAGMLKADLADASIPYKVAGPDGPLFADFHALRHTYLTMVGRAGASPKDHQSLARHGDVRLTLGVYSHADENVLGEVLDRLPLPGSGVPTRTAVETLALYRGLAAVLLGLPVAPPVAPDSAPNGNASERAETRPPAG